MILGAMQPYFFPYLGYYDLIARTDRWIVFDVVGYRPKSWMNRNRILHPTQGWQYVTVPVSHHRGDPISGIMLKDPAAARRRILGQLDHYRTARAPGFEAVCALVAETFDACGSGLLVDLNVATLTTVCRYLGIRFDYEILSRSGIELPEISHPGQWALELATALEADGYLNPPGGRALFDPAAFAARGIGLAFLTPPAFRYRCGRYRFVEHLSILDVLMWNEPETVRAQLGAPGRKGP